MVSGWRLFWIAALGSLLLIGGALESQHEMAAYAAQPPNVVMFLADDMGWTDWQYDAVRNPTGSVVYETPNLLALAQQSVVFNNAYAACPVCSPTRASILTGKNPARLKLTNFLPGAPNNTTLTDPTGWTHDLPGSEITLAESMKAGGYSTGFFGKWHLGTNGASSGIDPLQNGFDVNVGGNGYGGPDGAGGWFAGPDGMWAGMPGLSTPGQFPSTAYLSDVMDDFVSTYIQQHASGPFFLADWSFLPHIPLQAPQNLINKYQAKINTLQSQGVNLKGQTNATYAAMMEKLDQSVGVVLSRLNDPNQDGDTSDSIRDNTIIVFASDNGGAYDADGHPTVNLPAREGKGSIYEGGLRVPEMISWTGNAAVQAHAGTVTNQRTTSFDLYPTLLDMTGLMTNNSVPKNSNIDGVNIRASLEGNAFDRGLLYWHYPHRSNQDQSSALINGGSYVSAVADKDWKLIFFYEDRHYELYNLTSDIGETTNLLAYNPAIAHDLSLALQSYLLSVGAQMPVLIATGLPVAPPDVLGAPTLGDYNGDGYVTLADYMQWKSDFGSTTHLAADGNRNGIVDAADYTFWRKIYFESGHGSGLGSSAGVPEPGSALLLAIGMMVTACTGRRRRVAR